MILYLELSGFVLTGFMLFPLYVSLSCNQSNHKVTRIEFLQIVRKPDDMQLLKQCFLSKGYDISSKFRVFRALLKYKNTFTKLWRHFLLQ